MAISAIPLDQVSEADLQRLVDNRVPENITLEFKREAYGANDQAKKEWLKDISALANTAGGDLIIGVEEEDGVASKLVGISSTTADEEIRRLEAILQDGLEPRLIGTQIRPVDLSAGGFVLVVRVLRSWNAPHRVVYQRSNRFYGRNAVSAFELGVEQLRNAFLGVAETERQLTDFRLERLMRLKSGVATGQSLESSRDSQVHRTAIHGLPRFFEVSPCLLYRSSIIFLRSRTRGSPGRWSIPCRRSCCLFSARP